MKKKPKPRAKPATDVASFLRELEHPLRKEIEAVRKIILGVSPAIHEGIKWNAPSYRTDVDDFATFNLRSEKVVQLVFHTGAKVKARELKMQIADPAGLLDWRTSDRCLVTVDDVQAKGPALAAVVRAWIGQMPRPPTAANEGDIPEKIGRPATRALAAAGITRLAQLTKVTEGQLGELHGVGPRAVLLLRGALDAQGLTFKSAEKRSR